MSTVTKEKTRKEISERTAIKAIITSYVCYGLITFFIYNLLKSAVSSAIINNIHNNISILGYVVPAMFGILSVCLIHILCRLSTIDVFKKCSMDTSKTDYVMRNLKIFFVVIILTSIVYSFISLNMSLNLDSQSIQLSSLQYSQVFSIEHTKQLEQEMQTEFNNFRDYAFKDAFISEIFFIIGFISLSSFQRKMLETYNGKSPKNLEKIEKENSNIKNKNKEAKTNEEESNKDNMKDLTFTEIENKD